MQSPISMSCRCFLSFSLEVAILSAPLLIYVVILVPFRKKSGLKLRHGNQNGFLFACKHQSSAIKTETEQPTHLCSDRPAALSNTGVDIMVKHLSWILDVQLPLSIDRSL